MVEPVIPGMLEGVTKLPPPLAELIVRWPEVEAAQRYPARRYVAKHIAFECNRAGWRPHWNTHCTMAELVAALPPSVPEKRSESVTPRTIERRAYLADGLDDGGARSEQLTTGR